MRIIIHFLFSESNVLAVSCRGSVTLTGIRNYLRNTNPENVVAIYAGPFLGPFATSAFCLKQAYWTCTGRLHDQDPDTMELQNHEFKLMLKYLFFYHNLYSSFGESCVHDANISMEQFTEAIEDLLDDSMSSDQIRNNYAKLGTNPTFAVYVKEMTSVYLSDEVVGSHATTLIIEEKLRGGFGQARKSFLKEAGDAPSGRPRGLSVGGSDHLGSTSHETISCIRYTCSEIDTWIKQIQELGVVPFKSLIDDILVTRVVIARDIDDPTQCVMFMWHLDDGQGYRDFEEANMEDGGVFSQAAEEGVISIPFRHLYFSIASHDGWNVRMRPGDALNLSHFNTKSHIGFTDSLQEDIDHLGRTSGALQNYIGKQTGASEAGGAILSHYTDKSWCENGLSGTTAFKIDPPVKYMISGPVSNISCKILSTYETFTWLSHA